MENKSFSLSNYAHVAVEIKDGGFSIIFGKKPYEKPQVFATLSMDEWHQLKTVLPDIIGEAQAMWAQSQDGQDAIPASWEVTKFLSANYIMKLSSYRAPTGITYVTLAIKQFIAKITGELTFLKGVVLNYQELMALSTVSLDINNYLSEQLACVKYITLSTHNDCQKAQKIISDFFYHHHVSGGGKLRLILDKKPETPDLAVDLSSPTPPIHATPPTIPPRSNLPPIAPTTTPPKSYYQSV